MVIVYDQYDQTITTSDDGATSKSGLGGIGNNSSEVIISNNRAEAAAQASAAGQYGATASVFKNVYFEDIIGGGGYQSNVEITIDGFNSALIDSVAGNSRVRLIGFVHNPNKNAEIEIIDKVSSTFDLWTNNENFSVTIDTSVEIGGYGYEIGVQAMALADAFTTSASHADVATNDSLIQYTGRVKYDEISIEWV